LGQLTGGPGWDCEFDPSETGQDYSVSPNPHLRKTRPNKDSSIRKSKDSSLRKSANTKGSSDLKVEKKVKGTKLDAVKEVGGPKKSKPDIQEMTFKEFESTYHQFQTYLKVNFFLTIFDGKIGIAKRF
jgi:hypothetical protein